MKPITPHKRDDVIVAEWFTTKWRAGAVDGRIESAIGQRSGEPKQGSCYVGDALAAIDCSGFVAGTLTAKCWWKKAAGTVDPASKNGSEIIQRSEPGIDLTSEVDDTAKTITLADAVKYYGIHVYDDGQLVAIYLGEDSGGVKLRDSSGLRNHATVNNITVVDFFGSDPEVPISLSNHYGWNQGNTLFAEYGDTVNQLDPIGGNMVRVKMTDSNGQDYWVQTQDDGTGQLLDAPNGDAAGWDAQGFFTVYNPETNDNWNIVRLPSGLPYGTYRLDFSVETENGVRINNTSAQDQTMESAVVAALESSYQAKGGSGNIDQIITNMQEFYWVLSGTNPTHGEDYVDQMTGSTGYTSTDAKQVLSNIGIVSPDDFVQSFIDSGLESNTSHSNAWESSLRKQAQISDGATYAQGAGTRYLLTIDANSFVGNIGGFGDVNTGYFTNSYEQFLTELRNLQTDFKTPTSHDAHLRIYEISIEADNLIPVDLSNTTIDAEGNELENKGRLRLPLQLVESNCLISDAVWALRVDEEPITVSINGTDVLASVTITDNGDATWDITFPDSMKVFDLLINDVHYPCSRGRDNFVTGVKPDQSKVKSIIVSFNNSIWGKVDNYAFNAHEGSYDNEVDTDDLDYLGLMTQEEPYIAPIYALNGGYWIALNNANNDFLGFGDYQWLTNPKSTFNGDFVGEKIIYAHFPSGSTTPYRFYDYSEINLDPVVDTLDSYLMLNGGSLDQSKITLNSDISGVTRLDLVSNSFTQLPVALLKKFLDLNDLNIGINDVEDFDFSDPFWAQMTIVACGDMRVNIVSSDFSGLANIQELTLSQNTFDALPNISMLSTLKELGLRNSNIPDVDISQLTGLEILDIQYTSNPRGVTAWDFTANTGLIELNALRGIKAGSTLDVSGLANLKKLWVDNPDSINVTGCNALDDVRFQEEGVGIEEQMMLHLDSTGVTGGTFYYVGIPNRTLNTTDDVLNAFNSLDSKGWDLQGEVPS